MPVTSGDQSPARKYHTAKLVDHRRILVFAAAAISVALIPLALRVELDRTLKSAYVTSSDAYKVYRDFVKVFGDDEFIIVAIKTQAGASDPEVLNSLSVITDELKELDEIATVLSLSNLKFFQERKGIFSNYPVLLKAPDGLKLPPEGVFEQVHKALPLMDYLISPDKKTLGILIKLKPGWRFHPELGTLQDKIKEIVANHLPRNAQFSMTGASVIREEVQKLTVRTAVLYGVLCTIVIGGVCWYIFKSVRLALIILVVIGVAVEWVLGLMAAANIPLNSTTSLSFGLIVVVSVSNVIHIITHYYQALPGTTNRAEAVKLALRMIGRPCLMCTLTTAVAFATIMISSIPMVQQLGFVMTCGILISYILAMILTPAFLIAIKSVQKRTTDKITDDWISKAFRGLEQFVFTHYKLCAAVSAVFVLAMVAGIPFIRTDTQILHLFTDSSRVIADVRFVETNLAPIRSLELVVTGPEQWFKDPAAWQKIAALDKSIGELPEVESLDSPLPLMDYLHQAISKIPQASRTFYNDSRLLLQLFTVLSLNSDGKELLRRYLSPDYSQLHISIRIKNAAATPMNEIIQAVGATADKIMAPDRVIVTGEQAVFAAQASQVVDSQVLSLVLAFIGVTILLIIQLRSVSLGLVSLIPNIPPVAVIFGMMGWLGIPLDNVTVFAAAIAIGLSVDDTIHYLTQLKREMTRSRDPHATIEQCMRQSYQKTARAMISTSLTLFLGFLMLSFTPTKPAIYFGFLGGAAVVIALLGDLLMMQSVILTFGRVRRILNREIKIKGPHLDPVTTPANGSLH
ncbi:MAG: efflux RND transporter permease subunit [Desulfomonilaceae bacterium]